MIEVLHLRRHKAAAMLFWGFNGLGILLWVIGIFLTIEFIVVTAPLPTMTFFFPSQNLISETQEKSRLLAVTSFALGYATAGLISFFLAQTIRYLAVLAEKVGSTQE